MKVSSRPINRKQANDNYQNWLLLTILIVAVGSPVWLQTAAFIAVIISGAKLALGTTLKVTRERNG